MTSKASKPFTMNAVILHTASTRLIVVIQGVSATEHFKVVNIFLKIRKNTMQTLYCIVETK